MKPLKPVATGRRSPTGTEHFISTYRRSHFRLSTSLVRALDDPREIEIVIGRQYAYIGPFYDPTNEVTDRYPMKVDNRGKFSSRSLKNWLGDPAPGTHYAAEVVAPGIVRIDRRQRAWARATTTDETADTAQDGQEEEA